MSALVYWLSKAFASRRCTGALVCAVVVLALPGLFSGHFLDDYAHLAALGQVGELGKHLGGPLSLFSFTTGNPENTLALRDSGFFPWWTSSTVKLNFWRPISGLTHLADHMIAPTSAFFAHLHSLFWYVLAVLCAGAIYRQTGTRIPAATGLAVLLFAVDDAHALPVSWIANRNALVGLTLGLACIYAHIRWRSAALTTDAPRPVLRNTFAWASASVGAFSVALLSNEGAVAVLGYLVAYQVFLDSGRFWQRIARLTPYLAIAIGWRSAYQVLGFGASGSPMYVDPGSEPLVFLDAVVSRLPILATSLFVNVPGEPYEFLSPTPTMVWWWLSIGITVIVALAVIGIVRKSERSRFWALGTAITLLPAVATAPSGRLLVFASLGSAALIADLVFNSIDKPQLVRRVAAGTLLALHLIVAPLIFLAFGGGLLVGSKAMRTGYQSIDLPDEIGEKTMLIVNAPSYFITAYGTVFRELQGQPVAAATHNLSPNNPRPVETKVTRIDDRTLRYSPTGGYPHLMFRSADDPLVAGQVVELAGLQVEVLSVNSAGEAQEVEYHFPAPLESPEFVWKQVEGTFGLSDYTPLPVGESVTFHRKE